MAGVLDGIRVLDLTSGVAGPMATMLLADHGADVIRIEPPGGTPSHERLGDRAWNRGKRSAAFDLDSAEDAEAFRALAASADILVESFSPGTTERLGIDFATLSATNPRLVYCSITPYGRGTRDEQRPGEDALVAARTGLQWEQRGREGGSLACLSGKDPLFPDFEPPRERQQGPPRDGPLFPASRFPSLGAAYAAATAISAALRAREQTGRGQWVETSLLQGALAAGVLSYAFAENLEADFFNTWIGDSRSQKGHFECADGRWVHAWPPNPRFVLAAAEGDRLDASPDLTLREDPERIGLGPEEIFVLDHYWEPMANAMRKFSADEWTEAGAKAEVPIQTVRSPEEGLMDPLLLDDRIVAEIDDPVLGPIRTAGILFSMDRSPGEIRGPAPTPGQHTEEVRAEAARAEAQRDTTTGKKLPGGPLDGITVLDFGLAVAGPYGGQVLSDLGANVIKVNALHDWYWHSSVLAFACNRGKRSIAINMKHEKAPEAIHRLLESADVVLHNMRYRAAKKLGIDYESLKERYPRLVYCHTRGHEHGPRESLPGNDQTGACLAGVEWEDGGCDRGGKPFWSLTSMGDTGNGFLAAIAICQALYDREKTGRGQWVETAIVNAQLYNASHTVVRADGTPLERPRLDAMHLGFSAGLRLYPTSEGWLCLALSSDAHWQSLGELLGLAELQSGGRLATAEARGECDEEVAKLLERAFATASAEIWFERLDGAGIPVEISSETAGVEMWADPEFLERRLVAKYPHSMVGEFGQPGLAFDFSETPARVQGGPMLVGEHTREILKEIGFDEATIEGFFAEGVVGDEKVHPSLAKEGTTAAASPWEPS
ncbi:MAG: CoA transferase [Deltaproteobacteria bacterium]|jgi:crotonobetainyl-CoA:carnitine CoA-transferase CaiB-like acyl-CoA transferase|nr:CoA transferase [Deltaproteobacteria bacterium]MBW2496153.1 CoA transferase [Deltaproteobacteria bacterium]